MLKVLDDANDYSAVTHKAWEDISARYSANRLKTELEELFSELGL